MDLCKNCGRVLEKDEIAIYKRMVNRGATDFLCVACLAAHFNVSEDMIKEKIDHFRKMVCTLFE